MSPSARVPSRAAALFEGATHLDGVVERQHLGADDLVVFMAFSSHQDRRATGRFEHGAANGTRAIDLFEDGTACPVEAGLHVVQNPLRVFGARVVAREPNDVGCFRDGAPPTGQSYEVTAMEWFVIKHNQIHRRWGARDSATIMRQLGLPLE